MGGIVKPEEVKFPFWTCLYSLGDNYLQFDYFHEVLQARILAVFLTIERTQLIITQELGSTGRRGYSDGKLPPPVHSTLFLFFFFAFQD